MGSITAAGRDDRTGPIARLVSRVFATRLGALAAVTGLVLVVCAVFIVLGQSSLSRSIEVNLGVKASDLVHAHVDSGEASIDQAEQVLDGLAGFVAGHAAELAGGLEPVGEAVFSGRDGVGGAAIELADGTIWSLTRDPADRQRLRIGRAPPGAGSASAEWREAARADGRSVWTVRGWSPGGTRLIRCTRAVRVQPDPGRDPAVVAVVRADLDIGAIETGMRRLAEAVGPTPPPAGEARPVGPMPSNAYGPLAFAFACTPDGRILVTGADLDDSAQRALVVAATARAIAEPAASQPTVSRFAHAGEPYLLGVHHLSRPEDAPWIIATVFSSQRFAAPATAHLHRSLAIGLLVLVASVGLALLLANHLTRQRRLVSAARAQAASAEERLRALGSYRMLRKLGEGGMGTVWLAEHEMLARPAAVKLIQAKTFAATPEAQQVAIERFAREAQVTASLRCRNTVTLYDYGLAADGSFYYAMELLDGLDLEDLTARHGPQRPGRVIAILIQICRSLGEAHARGMVHRDVKPANIFLCRLGPEVDVVKVLDFGLVTASDPAASRAKLVLGTPAFMAPEQACGLALDGRSDLYALGCVAYWLLTGRYVFELEDSRALMEAHSILKPPELTVPAPPELIRLIASLLEKDPAWRPRRAEDVQEILEGIVCPPAFAWTDADAQAWWSKRESAAAPAPAGGDESPTMLMPLRSAAGITVDETR